MLMMAALLQLIPRAASASAASFSRGRNACRGTGSQTLPSSSSPLPPPRPSPPRFGVVGCMWSHLACLQGPDGVGGVDEGHVLRRLGGQCAAACGASVVDQEVEASASHLLLHLPDCCLDAVGVCHICTGTGGLGDRLGDVVRGSSQSPSIFLGLAVTWLS